MSEKVIAETVYSRLVCDGKNHRIIEKQFGSLWMPLPCICGEQGNERSS